MLTAHNPMIDKKEKKGYICKVKQLKIIIMLLVLTNYATCQNRNYEDYYTSSYQVFSTLDSSFIYNFLKGAKIKCLTETKYYYDSLGNIKDSSIVNYYKFDSLGRIIEKRYDYVSNSTKYRSSKYTYLKNGSYKVTNDNPIETGVLDGVYVRIHQPLPMYCETLNDKYQIETITLKTEFEGEISTMQFFYNSDFLISGLRYFEGSKLVYRHKITYEK